MVYEQLFRIGPDTRNLLKRKGFLKPLVKSVIVEQLTKDLDPPKEMKDKLAEKWTKAQQWMIENTNADHRRYESMISYLLKKLLIS